VSKTNVVSRTTFLHKYALQNLYNDECHVGITTRLDPCYLWQNEIEISSKWWL